LLNIDVYKVEEIEEIEEMKEKVAVLRNAPVGLLHDVDEIGRKKEGDWNIEFQIMQWLVIRMKKGLKDLRQ
jgi:hypothetical protein